MVDGKQLKTNSSNNCRRMLIYLIVGAIVFVVVENNRICIVFILCSVSFIACVVLCAVFCLSMVCYFV
jgi:hypothetical protein